MDERRTCFVGGYSYGVDELDLSRAFTRFGPIEAIKVERDSEEMGIGYGFVTFKRRKDMLEAVREMDGATLMKGLSVELFDDEKVLLGGKITVREGVEVVGFPEECERCGHLGHTKSDCNSIDLADPRHELKGNFINDSGPCYQMTEDDWPWNPPDGWSPGMYREYKRQIRAQSVPPLFGVKEGVDLRERMVHVFEVGIDFPYMIADRFDGPPRPMPRPWGTEKWSQSDRESYEARTCLAALQERVDDKKRCMEEARLKKEEEDREEKEWQERLAREAMLGRIEREKQRWRAQLCSRSYADAIRLGVSH